LLIVTLISHLFDIHKIK